MIYRELYAICDICGKCVLLPECHSISTSTYTWIRNHLYWSIGRNGKFVCDDCKRKLKKGVNYEIISAKITYD